jgi:Hydantoin racemase
MVIKIVYINPVGTSAFDKPMKEFLDNYRSPDTDITVVSLEKGPWHLEYYSYDALVIPDVLKVIREFEGRGYDAAIIGCFYDPGLHEAREVSDMVITAPGESSIHIASTLGDRFSIIVGRRKWIPLMEQNVVKYGFRDKLVSFESVELGVWDFHKDVEETKRRLIRAAKNAVDKGAEVLILGCTVLFGFFKDLEKEVGVPVVDPIIASLKYAEFLVELKRRMGWTWSRIGMYEKPPREEIEKWKLPL